ncbi:Erythroid differentiation-related factor 1 [Phytophthora citrophthora]|uniref:Erythroid differentiation-related factor 1 n=1 Tax=Phytophthora citrophthora TaxID=4793 RepID=A0AAD9GTX2_9STRA|nr:Erythroid differentiation-related factor 1 [Phytophthora citrophthora]
MDQELSLCTVLDYYLDNVIANIPELAICMHSKGLVRGYKLVETRQIPYMSGTDRPLFDVQDVSLNASMLLKFLQENCSRPNGTYWLHRKEGESSLRLYDVDVLSQGSQLKWKYMMAMLCYRFAARASRLANSLAAGTPHLQQQLQHRQRELLRTCMSLLGEIAQKGGATHSSICSSVSEQLADTYLRECNQFHASNFADSSSPDSDREVAIQSLEKAKQYLLASIKLFEECIPKHSDPALTHSDDGTDGGEVIGEGELAPENEDGEVEMGSFMDEELNRLQLKFSSACLELGQLYAGCRKWVDAVKCIVEASQFLSLSSIPEGMERLDLASPGQDSVVNALLDKLDFDGVGRGGFSQDKIPICISGAELRCSLLGLIGDMAAQRPVEVYNMLAGIYEVISGVKRHQFSDLCGSWSEVMKTFGDDSEFLDSTTLASKEEGLMMLSFLAYLRALSPPADSELYFMMMKKLGNASNELGKYFLGEKRDYKEAFRWFERGCRIFNDIEDGVNVALLRANMAHLHKIFAQGKSADSRENHYRTAIQLCTNALHLLKQSKADTDLNQKVKGELALTYLVWAVDMANNVFSTARSPATSQENEALKIFNKALSLYAELEDQKQVASTHYQIASFYSRIISGTIQADRDSTASDKADGASSTLTSRMEIARRHYEKALGYFGAVEVGKTFVLIHQELADLHILGGRVEGIEHALLILLNTYEAFNSATSRDLKLEEEMTSLAHGIVTKVKGVLHQLIRLSAGGRVSSTKSKKLEMFKKMYKEVIYYDGYSAASIVPILGTLRAIYTA